MSEQYLKQKDQFSQIFRNQSIFSRRSVLILESSIIDILDDRFFTQCQSVSFKTKRDQDKEFLETKKFTRKTVQFDIVENLNHSSFDLIYCSLAAILTEDIKSKKEFFENLNSMLESAEDGFYFEWQENEQNQKLLESYHIKAHEIEQLLEADASYLSQIEISEQSRVYWVCKKTNLHDLSWKAPLCFDKKYLISSRLLHGEENVYFWSRVYKVENKIYKQATSYLNDHEILASNKIADKEILNISLEKQEEDWSLISYPFFEGDLLSEKIPDLNESEILDVFDQILKLVENLEKIGIKHRDLHPGNVLVSTCNKKVHIIDFGWASISGLENVSPVCLGNGLDLSVRSEIGPSDVYACAKIAKILGEQSANSDLKVLAFIFLEAPWQKRPKNILEFRQLYEAIKKFSSQEKNFVLYSFENLEINNSDLKEKNERLYKDLSSKVEQLEISLRYTVDLENLKQSLEKKVSSLEDELKHLHFERERSEAEKSTFKQEIDRLSSAYNKAQVTRFNPKEVGIKFYLKQLLAAIVRKFRKPSKYLQVR